MGLRNGGSHPAVSQPQPGGAFRPWPRCSGMPGSWPEMMLGDGVVLDPLEWKVPLPSGSPPTSLTELGFGRLCILSDDLAGLAPVGSIVSGSGTMMWSPPGRTRSGCQELRFDAEMFLCSDPDGHCGAVRLKARTLYETLADQHQLF